MKLNSANECELTIGFDQREDGTRSHVCRVHKYHKDYAHGVQINVKCLVDK